MTKRITNLFRPEHLTLSRRRLVQLCLALSGFIMLDGLRKFLGYQEPSSPASRLVLGPPTAYAMGSVTPVPQAQCWILRDAAGLYALSAVCTHLGCLVRMEADESFSCPCHGSRFRTDGGVVVGPAGRSLPHLALRLTADHLLEVDTRQIVPASTRLDPRSAS